MGLMRYLVAIFLLLAVLTGCNGTARVNNEPILLTPAASPPIMATNTPVALSPKSDTGTVSECPVTVANGNTPPGERQSAFHHGNGALWTGLWPEGKVVFQPGGSGFIYPDGSLSMKFPWWRGVVGELTIDGRRLDAPAPPLRASIPDGYFGTFQASSLIFPTEGCWEVTGGGQAMRPH